MGTGFTFPVAGSSHKGTSINGQSPSYSGFVLTELAVGLQNTAGSGFGEGLSRQAGCVIQSFLSGARQSMTRFRVSSPCRIAGPFFIYTPNFFKLPSRIHDVLQFQPPGRICCFSHPERIVYNCKSALPGSIGFGLNSTRRITVCPPVRNTRHLL